MKITHGERDDIGLRPQMEDAHAVMENREEDLFSAEVYDGHGGRTAAAVASEMMTPYLLSVCSEERTKPPEERRRPSELVREAYLATDSYIGRRGIESGTAAVTLHFKEDRFLAANVGDSRAIMGKRDGVVTLTVDHKPDLPAEKARIEALGGSVISWGVARVQGVLAMSRALGDPGLHPFVSSEPRVVEGLLGKENDYAVLACDGVWDVLTPDEVISIVRECGDPQEAADKVVATALAEGTSDNVTVIVLDLRAHTAALDRETMEITYVLDRAAAPPEKPPEG